MSGLFVGRWTLLVAGWTLFLGGWESDRSVASTGRHTQHGVQITRTRFYRVKDFVLRGRPTEDTMTGLRLSEWTGIASMGFEQLLTSNH